MVQRPDNRLALIDQGFFAGHRAVGQTEVMQTVWLYEHPINLEEIKRVHRDLSHGLLSRLIERSPLPFGRSRWVINPSTPEIDIAEQARPRAEFSDWADERAHMPLDPELGPGWYLSILPLTDGSTAISLVISHYVIDGIGATVATVQAILGITHDFGYPLPRSRGLLRALAEDAGQTARAIPEVARALSTAVKEARTRRDDSRLNTSPSIGLSNNDGEDYVVSPGVAVWIDIADWDTRAKALGGTSNTLAAALTARLGDRMGFRHDDDGTVTVQLVVNDRTEGDTRAIAVSFARVHIDPKWATSDLRTARTDIKQALASLRETPDHSSQLAPLIPFTPKRAWKRLFDRALDDPDRPVVCSNFGNVGELVTRLDGTQAERGYARGVRQNVTRQWLERVGGQLLVQILSAPGPGKVAIYITGYRTGTVTTKPALRELVRTTLTELGLAGEID